jgi:hypothetical protein
MWKVILLQDALSMHVRKEPCWFHRKMQELILGVKWVRMVK